MQNRGAFREWARLVGEVICDFLFLSIWLILTWAVHECVGRHFPLHGVPFYVSSAIECVFDISTLLRLYRLRINARGSRFFRRLQ
jgi:hypothetical protein